MAPAQTAGMNLTRVAFWLLAAFVASVPAENGITLPGIGSISRLLGLVTFGVAAVSLFRNGRFHFRPPSLFVVVALLFVLWNAITFFWSNDLSATFSNLITLAQLFVVVWLIWQFCRSDEDTTILLQAFVLGCYVTIGVALATFIGSPDPDFRNVGNFNPNTFAIVSALAIPMSWLLTFRQQGRFLGLLNAAYPALALLGIVLSASRGGLITGLVALLIIPFGMSHLSLGRRLLLFVLVAAGVWAGFVYAPEVFPQLERNIERLSSTSDELTGGTLTGRTTIWATAIQLFLESPVGGVGSGAFAHTAEPILGEFKDPHNAFLAVASETGLVGLLLYALLLLTAFISVIKLEGSARLAFLVLLAALLVGMFPANAENDKFAWVVLSLLAVQRPLVLAAPAPRGAASR